MGRRIHTPSEPFPTCVNRGVKRDNAVVIIDRDGSTVRSFIAQGAAATVIVNDAKPKRRRDGL